MSNQIHPTAVIGADVELGSDNTIGPYAVVLGPTRMGDANWIGPHASIGTPGQIRGSDHGDWTTSEGLGVHIGSANVVREFANIHRGSELTTSIGDDCYLMVGSHVPHDAVIESGVTLANAVQLGGHTWIGRGANLGLGTDVHQFGAIGEGTMVGMNSTVTRHLPPLALAVGSPAKLRGANRIGMERTGFDPDTIEQLDQHYRSGATSAPTWVEGALAEAFARFGEESSRRER